MGSDSKWPRRLVGRRPNCSGSVPGTRQTRANARKPSRTRPNLTRSDRSRAFTRRLAQARRPGTPAASATTRAEHKPRGSQHERDQMRLIGRSYAALFRYHSLSALAACGDGSTSITISPRVVGQHPRPWFPPYPRHLVPGVRGGAGQAWSHGMTGRNRAMISRDRFSGLRHGRNIKMFPGFVASQCEADRASANLNIQKVKVSGEGKRTNKVLYIYALDDTGASVSLLPGRVRFRACL